LPPPSPLGGSEADATDSDAAEARAREALDHAVSAGFGEDVDLLKVRARQALEQACRIHRRGGASDADAPHQPPAAAGDVSAPAGDGDMAAEASHGDVEWTAEELEDIKRRARSALFAFIDQQDQQSRVTSGPRAAERDEVAGGDPHGNGGGGGGVAGPGAREDEEEKEEAEPPEEFDAEAFEHAKQRARIAVEAVLIVESGTMAGMPSDAA